MNFNNIVMDLLGDKCNIKTLFILAHHPEGLTGRGLAHLVGVSTFKMHTVLKFLTAQGVLIKTNVGNGNLYRLNEEHVLIKQVLTSLFDFQKGLIDGLGSDVIKKFEPKPISVILYGSIARGDDKPDSDIDIVLIYNDREKPKEVDDKIWQDIPFKYGNNLSVKHVSVTELKEALNKKDSFARNLIKEGRSIAGMSLMEVLNYGGSKIVDRKGRQE